MRSLTIDDALHIRVGDKVVLQAAATKSDPGINSRVLADYMKQYKLSDGSTHIITGASWAFKPGENTIMGKELWISGGRYDTMLPFECFEIDGEMEEELAIRQHENPRQRPPTYLE